MVYQVYKIHSDFYYLKNNNGDFLTCKLKDILKKQHVEICVGDFVQLSKDKNFISKLESRKNVLNKPHVANIDLALVVSSLKEPKLDFIQLNRYLTYLKYHKINCAICFNKEDLEQNLVKTKKEIEKIYSILGYKTFFTSAKNNLDLEELKEFIKGKTITLCGLSGVGKSTLLNTLSNKNILKTGVVSKKNNRGCHTTRHCEIIDFDDFRIIDTPGFSHLKFDFLLPNQLIDLFDDLKIYKKDCKYKDCLHDNIMNDACSIIKNLDKIDKTRYESYLNFLKEAKEYKEKISSKSIKFEGFNKKVGNLTLTKISKRKRNFSRKKENQNLKDSYNE